jgi:Fur family transcriptional regulator, ferric uptake regulator
VARVAPSLDATLAEIRAGGGRVTPARRAVLRAVLEGSGHHFTAADIFDAVEGATPRPDRATVYRTLELLTEIGLLTPLQLDGDAAVYHRTDHRHGHLVCIGCGAIAEIPARTLTSLGDTMERQTGFRIDPERVAIPGSCARCASAGVS